MRLTTYSRKMDDLGRLVIPAPLREQLNIQTGTSFDFYVYESEEGKIYLCIECPQASSEVERAKRVLAEAGYTFQQ